MRKAGSAERERGWNKDAVPGMKQGEE
jgi:hypothetical protein